MGEDARNWLFAPPALLPEHGCEERWSSPGTEALILAIVASMAFDPIGSGTVMLDGSPGFGVAPLDLLRDAARGLLGLQREIQQSLASEFRAARESTSAMGPLALMGTAFAFGAVHAVTPGHGKSVVASYFIGQGGAPRRGLTMSAKVIATHVLSAIVLVLAATFLVDISLGARPADFPMVRLVSYAGVSAIGGSCSVAHCAETTRWSCKARRRRKEPCRTLPVCRPVP